MILLQFLGAAAFYDWRSRRIPNPLVLSCFGLGLVLQTILGPSAAAGIGAYLFCFILTLIFLLPIFYCFGAGAGDLKLTALVAAYLGFEEGAVVLLPGLAIALGWHLLREKYSPFALAVFLGAAPRLTGLDVLAVRFAQRLFDLP